MLSNGNSREEGCHGSAGVLNHGAVSALGRETEQTGEESSDCGPGVIGIGAGIGLGKPKGTMMSSHWIRKVTKLGALAGALLALGATGVFQTARACPTSVDGEIYCLAPLPDGRMLVGGEFTELLGEPRANLALLCTDGALDRTFTAAVGEVRSLAVQPNGGILVGGYFSTFGGRSCSNLGRLNADGTPDATFNVPASGGVLSMAVQSDGMILVGGGFTSLGGQAHRYIGRLTSAGKVDAAFKPGAGSTVNCLAVQSDGKILVGGMFTNLCGQLCPYLGRLNADGSLDTTFRPGADNLVMSLGVQRDGKILVAGSFQNLGGRACQSIGRLNSDGTLDTAFTIPAVSSTLGLYPECLAIQPDGKVLVGGLNFGLHDWKGLVRFNADGSFDSSLPKDSFENAYCLAVGANGAVWAGGDRMEPDELLHIHLQRVDATPQISPGLLVEQRLKSFGFAAQSGAGCQAPLAQGADGALYGVTSAGGINGAGTVFRINPDGTGHEVLHSFSPATGDGRKPTAALVQGGDGALYGTTQHGGAAGNGTVFKVGTNGLGYRVIRSFTTADADGRNPTAALVQGRDGALYGVTEYGGSNWGGTVFRLNPDDSSFSVLHGFDSFDTAGSSPATLMQGSDGTLYGTTEEGGRDAGGTIFKLNPDGTGFTVLHKFSSYTGKPTLVQGRDGALYGTAPYDFHGASTGQGTVFKLNTDGTGYAVLRAFDWFAASSACRPAAPLVQGNDGFLYGTTEAGGTNSLGVVFRIATNGAGFAILHHFSADTTRGQTSPDVSGLLQLRDGFLCGTTPDGGISGNGAVFKLNTNGADFALVYSFSPWGGDGQHPCAGLLQGKDGALYGVAQDGGDANRGSVFRLDLDGSDCTFLHHFQTNNAGGLKPCAALVQGDDGTLYGATWRGGGTNDAGTIFKLNPDGTGFTSLHSLNGADGRNPSGLLRASGGVLYGTACLGGQNGKGVVFKLNADGLGWVTLHHFGASTSDGMNPAGLARGNDGQLYGTTSYGGDKGCGTVFKLSPDGSGYLPLHSFDVDGRNPSAAPMQGSDGALYGTTLAGGDSGRGSVFKLNADGTGYRVLHSFTGSDGDGQYPRGALVQASDGALYGTTDGGVMGGGAGTAFRLNPDRSGYTVLCGFAATDCRNPLAGLTLGSDGALYGITAYGGDFGGGTMFRLVWPSPAFTSITRLPDRTVRLSFNVEQNVLWRIDASADLVDWVPLTSVTATNGPIQVLDTNATDFPQRFYRATRQP